MFADFDCHFFKSWLRSVRCSLTADLRTRVCLCVCVGGGGGARACVCVCVCACVRACV